ncbi:MAG: hypothetical protein M3352_07220 [Bacteroidota bacterium]|nr:hypothetical protein [Bacteroidota bacterium]
MKSIISISALFILILACNKDKFQTKPQIKIVSVSDKFISSNGSIDVTLEFTDKEGDVNDSLFVIRERINRRGPLVRSPLPYKIPSFPNTTKGEFFVSLDYRSLTLNLSPIRIIGSVPVRNEPDTLNLKFVVQDKEGNKSDTATVDNVIIIR